MIHETLHFLNLEHLISVNNRIEDSFTRTRLITISCFVFISMLLTIRYVSKNETKLGGISIVTLIVITIAGLVSHLVST